MTEQPITTDAALAARIDQLVEERLAALTAAPTPPAPAPVSPSVPAPAAPEPPPAPAPTGYTGPSATDLAALQAQIEQLQAQVAVFTSATILPPEPRFKSVFDLFRELASRTLGADLLHEFIATINNLEAAEEAMVDERAAQQQAAQQQASAAAVPQSSFPVAPAASAFVPPPGS